MKLVVLVIAGEGVGGVEKRLSEVWLHLAPRLPQLRMLVRRATFDQLCERPDLASLGDFSDRITRVEAHGTSFAATWTAFAPALWRLPHGCVVHHLLQAPPLLHRLRRHRVLLSWVGTSFPRAAVKFADWAASTLSVRAADRVDVLNPEIMRQLAADSSLAPKLRLTEGGTIVDGETFRPGEKQDLVVFLGRIERYKNAAAFVEAIPAMAERLAALGRWPAFRLYGRPGDQEAVVRDLLASPPYSVQDVTWEQTSDPASVLARAKVFVSLQSPSNYPSKALAEAMAAGCIPVITDSGESKRMADPALACFIPEHFTSEELVEAVCGIMTLDEAAFTSRSAAIREQALRRFAIEPQARYFQSLYEQLGAGA